MPSSRPPDTTFTNVCLPWLTHNYSILPYFDDQRTDVNAGCAGFPGGTCGIFTSVTGSAPDRIFNIEWRTVYFNNTSPVGQPRAEVVRGAESLRCDLRHGAQGNASATAECRATTPTLTSTSATAQVVRLLAGKATYCNRAELHANANSDSYTDGNANSNADSDSNGTPTATPPPTPTPTPTATPSVTPLPRPTPGPSGTPHGTPPPRP